MHQHAVKFTPEGFLYGRIVGDSERSDAEQFKADTEQILAAHPDEVLNAFVDLSEAGHPSTEAQKIYAAIMAHPQIGKIALVGATELPTMYAQVVTRFAHKETVKFFSDSEEARTWLTVHP